MILFVQEQKNCQVFIIHGWLMEQMFPCVYVLLKDKKEVTYNKMIICLRDRLFELGFTVSPNKKTSDYELVSINACSRQFGIKLKGCHFQFLQAGRKAIDTLILDQTVHNVPQQSNTNILVLARGRCRGRGRGRGRGRNKSLSN
ncbi:unnamed protein product [Brachionus calyciflorus]|uniref:Uncharacterized protein n=1 Tax=Brachionus calyciflorus TaxID=104777 RepID=A0A814ALC9_9BILA|nr:unnamed protein product [Brachionus calyciflorus]